MEDHGKAAGRRRWIVLAGALALGGVIVLLALFFGGRDLASQEAQPVHLDGTGANALVTTYEAHLADLPAGDRELLLEVPLPGQGALERGRTYEVRVQCQELADWRRTVTFDQGDRRIDARVPFTLSQPTSCRFTVEVSGLHLGDPMRLRVR